MKDSRRPDAMPTNKSREVLVNGAFAAVTALLAVFTIHGVLERTHGAPAVPLDDTYIHFQYARSFASGHPFRYTPGAVPTPGATSLLWPMILAPFYALGLHGDRIVWAAWALGWASLGLLAAETRRLAEGLTRPSLAIASGAMVLAFGGFTWFAASGMEVVPFAWLLTRAARRSAEWVEAEPSENGSPDATSRRYRELVLLAALCPLMRPEGVLGSLTVAAALIIRRPGGIRRAVPALLSPLLPPIVCFLFTGHAVTSTALAKWLPLNPYYRLPELVSAISANLQILFGTLLNGELWTSVFLPSGGKVVAWLAFVAPFLVGVMQRRLWRAAFVVALAAGMLIPTTYETFLVNRVRYIWPFAPGFVVGLACLAESIGAFFEDGGTGLRRFVSQVPLVFAGVVVGFFLSRLGPSMDDLATSSEAVWLQQVSLGKWAATALPAEARIGVNDTGAIAYFSSRTTFDVVGLTSAGEARYWAAGAGSRFEHYEKLPKDRRPTHFIVYPEWMAVDPVLGDALTWRTVRHTILGGTTMVAYRARYDLLGSGELPESAAFSARPLADALDVADLESEAAHGYRLFGATKANDVVVEQDGYADGARRARHRDEFRLRLVPGGSIVVRLGSTVGARVGVRADGRLLGVVALAASAAEESAVPVPADLPEGTHAIDVSSDEDDRTFDSLHYWAYR